jgi:1-acyl-sn-glycerol-3-phosphate acyltransferase
MLSRLLYRLAHRLLGLAARLVWRLDVVGTENVPASGPVIIASNHLSFIDSVVIPLAMPRPVTFLAKSDYFTGRGLRGWLVRLFFTAIGAVPVQRDGSRDALAALALAREVLGRGEAFGIYPEGTRSRDGRLYRGRTGVAWLALATRTPIVPVALLGTDQVQPVGSRGLRVHRVRVRFGAPIDPAPLAELIDERKLGPGRARRDLTDSVMGSIAAMSDQERAPGYNPVAADETVSP